MIKESLSSRSARHLVYALAGAASLAVHSAAAATYSWVPSTGGNWDLTTANWNDGVSTTAWVNGVGNAASFGAFGAGPTISLTTNIVAGTLTTNGGATLVLNGAGTLDVTTITTGNSGSIDLSVKLTGSHGLTLTSTGAAGSQGRLNIKAAADYTGDTTLSGTAYLLSDNVSNALPITTTLNMSSGTTFRFAKNGVTQEIAGLAGNGTVTSSATGSVLTLRTKSGVTTAYSGSMGFTGGGVLSVVVAGSGTQTLSGGNLNYNGSTTVSSGTLLLGASLNNSSSVTVSGGTLNSSALDTKLGAGAVSMSSGTIDIRGSAAGKFTLAAGQNFTTTGGTIKFDLGTGTDQIIGSGVGAFSLTNTTLALILGTGFDYSNSYTLFSGFSGGSLSGLVVSGYDTTNYTASLSNAGVLSFAAVPEPSTIALGALGVALIAFRLRRRAI
ncbi:PEP-CTERM protein-sorting domain-containing protein [Terrimicrobium sacchariphilum]|uniref:PEP-CTERM protein-sorting domain-containing protein n=1 Tax=Terrimicrobium sacchariphilum TaxID=690879 RepID=A0A146G9U3_TERSA|nr:PEP-CTERM sorting domain-containing protein [Terrimicrobium sacchariphilum]GAT33597.1 PEP-CTERM protein-sorting domain-containing protein [Terrimicrobium sacchariphilum]